MNAVKPIAPKELEKINQKVMKYLVEKNYLLQEKNVIDAKKAFVAASIVRFALLEKAKGRLNEERANAYFIALSEYEKDNVILFWNNGLVKATKIKEPTNAKTKKTKED